MRRSVDLPAVADDREALAKASALLDAAALLLWDAGRYVRASSAVLTSGSDPLRRINYDACDLSERAESVRAALDARAKGLGS